MTTAASLDPEPADEITRAGLKALSGVRLPRKYEVASIAEAMQRHLGRELQCEAVPRARLKGASGLFTRGEKRDYLYFAVEASSLTQAFSACHEWGHVLDGTELHLVPDPIIERYGPEGLLLTPGYSNHFIVTRCLMKKTDPAEQRAETIAGLIYDAVGSARRGHGRSTGGLAVERDLLSRVFGPPR